MALRRLLEVRAGVVSLGLILLLPLLSGCGQTGDRGQQLDPTEQIQRGEALFQRDCASCHSVEPGDVEVGPSLAGIAERAGARVAGMEARSYLEQSIRRPRAFVVPGFEPLMPPTFNTSLTDQQIESLIAYMMSLDP